jgi:hypothetical protein
MKIINQLPADELIINAKAGDSLTLPLDFDINMTNYVISVNCSGVPVTLNNNLPSGIINITFTTAGFRGSYPWELKWTTPEGLVRTALTGELVVS